MLASIQEIIVELWTDMRIQAGVSILVSILAAYVLEFVFRRSLLVMASKTQTDLDDKIVAALRRPLFWTVILAGVSVAVPKLLDYGLFSIFGTIKTLIVVLWTVASMRVAGAMLSAMSSRAKPDSVIQPRTLPVFDMLSKILIISVAAYFTFLAWHINVSAWLASAGIVGIAVGFAARDSLANLFAGIGLLADNIYKVGDFILLDNNQQLRGRVTRIGMRSTRILTLDDIEVTVPNALIGNATVINEVGGPNVHQRIRAKVSAAYGSDIDRVFEVLAACPEGVEGVSNHPKPMVHFVGFGASGLEFDLMVWITNPAERDTVISRLNARVYKAFAAADIEIPYSKHDVYIKEMSGARAQAEPDDAKPDSQT